MTESAKTYDVAFSLLSRNIDLARQLRDALTPHLKIFLYEGNQEVIAGTNGVETFSRIFKNESRLNVILYNSKYGTTPWTRIENDAIQARALKEGWSTVLLISTEQGIAPPVWYPPQNILASMPEYGLETMAGIIKHRAREAGAPEREESAAEMALRMDREQNDHRRRLNFLGSTDGVNSAMEEVARILNVIEDGVGKVSNLKGRSLVTGRTKTHFAAAGQVSLNVIWSHYATNSTDQSFIATRICDGIITVPNHPGTPSRPARNMFDYEYHPFYDRGDVWMWKADDGKQYNGDVLAEKIMRDYFQRLFRTTV